MADLDHYIAVNREANASGIHVKKRLIEIEAGVYAEAYTLVDSSGNPATPDGEAVSGSLTAAGVLFTADMLGYESVSVHVTSAGTSCTVTYETSDDNSNWVATSGQRSIEGGTSGFATTSTDAAMRLFPRRGRYFRARVSTYGSGTVSAVGTLHKNPGPYAASPAAVQGLASHDAVITGGPVRIGARAVTANYTAVATGDTADLVTTLVGALIQKPFSIPEADWAYAAAAGGIVDSTAIAIKAAGAAGLRNYVTGLDCINTHASVATEIAIRDGAAGTVLWRTHLPALGAGGRVSISFDTPLKGTAATLLEVVCLTTGSAVFFNARGYTAP